MSTRVNIQSYSTQMYKKGKHRDTYLSGDNVVWYQQWLQRGTKCVRKCRYAGTEKAIPDHLASPSCSQGTAHLLAQLRRLAAARQLQLVHLAGQALHLWVRC